MDLARDQLVTIFLLSYFNAVLRLSLVALLFFLGDNLSTDFVDELLGLLDYSNINVGFLKSTVLAFVQVAEL